MEKFIKDGKIAVLYSPGFGAGWSTWNYETGEKCVFSPEIVQKVINGEDITEEFCEQLFGVDYVCTLGCEKLKIKWLDPGTQFVIEEYDGSESIILLDVIQHYTA